MNSLLRKLPKPAFVFALALPLLWLRFGHWFYLSLDEGIYLEGARRVASGEVPYRDFFAITGPGTFWIYGSVFHFFGTSFAAARAVLCLELAATCAAIYYLVNRTTGALFATSTALLYLAMLLTTLYPIYITHRWDSNTFALLALCCLDRRPLLAGILAAVAVWITPPLLLVALALAFFTKLRPYLIGIAIPTTAALAGLVSQGALVPLIDSLLWDTTHYAAANRLTWGALSLTFQSFRADLLHYADSILPAVLPPVALVLALITRKHRLLTITALAALASCYPRFGAAQLLFCAAFFWVLAAVSLPRRAHPHRVHPWLAAATTLLAVSATIAAWPHETLKQIDTPVGSLQVSRRHFVTLNDLLSATRPGERAFVYPYLPALYFALGLQNPTGYAWLQPGMMGDREVGSAIASLDVAPPRWIIWHDFTESYILKNWPASDRTRLRFPKMESYLRSNYHEVIPDGVPTIGFKLMEKNP